jgi:hypothetical protein
VKAFAVSCVRRPSGQPAAATRGPERRPWGGAGWADEVTGDTPIYLQAASPWKSSLHPGHDDNPHGRQLNFQDSPASTPAPWQNVRSKPFITHALYSLSTKLDSCRWLLIRIQKYRQHSFVTERTCSSL